MEMQDIKIICLPTNFAQHHQVIGKRVGDMRFQAQGCFSTSNKFCGCKGISACKKRNIMTLTNKFFGKIGNDTFRSAI